ncbi:galactose-binding domain-containing protein [Paramicrobacterium fandaimingii]|uniref:galactose-binding domain-containing protein n=1 Tax=Paramicrobacterium fandaimingii TaxID=2708079 RepID=UPI0014215DFB|nr:hypothetical protein [Microbacterium fandaimingii]
MNGTTRRQRKPSRRRAAYIVGAIVLTLAVTGAVAVAFVDDEQPGSRAVASLDLDPAVEVCGMPGDKLAAVVADRPKSDDPVSIGVDVRAPSPESTYLVGLHAIDGGLLVESQKQDGTRVFTRLNDSGDTSGEFVVDVDRATREPHNNGSVAVSPDGLIYAIDSYKHRRDIAVFDAEGTQISSFPVPESSVTQGHPLDLHGVTWVPDLDGEPALLVGERGSVVHVFREDGTSLGVNRDLPSVIFGASGSLVTGLEPIDDATVRLTVDDLASQKTVMSVPYAMAESDGDSAAQTPALTRPSTVVPAPGGDGYLVYEAGEGLTWIDQIGVQRGVWLGDSQASPSMTGAIVHDDGSYWLSVSVDGEEHVRKLTDDDMAAMLAMPISYKALNDPVIARLGIGVGVVSDAVFNHADWGETLGVHLRFESGWGMLDGEQAAEDVSVRYSVRGDPLLADPIRQTERSVEPKIGGGETPLEVPTSVPGPYEVSVRLVDSSSGETLSATCFRYSVGAEGADLNLDDLEPGAGWGGPEPMRGVQLADRLGIGSFRLQLDVSRLIADPSGKPSSDAIDWSGLPGAPDGEPTPTEAFEQVRAAAEYAADHDVDLIVQVGQNGDAERAAVEAETWGGWARFIVAEFAEQASAITLWSPWNEPNISFDSGADFSKRVDIPFAHAAHEANSHARVIAGNTLGFAEDWWADSASTQLCEAVDALGVHPYTGWNRSWEEEGFAASGSGYDSFRNVVGHGCGELPIWDTETGWTSDGTLPYWSQGAKVARKLLWYQHEHIAGWTYFFSEGGWGENNLSWSLIQYQSHVKPGALAFAVVSHKLAALGEPSVVETGIPFTYAFRFADDAGVTAAWTDEARVRANLSSEAPAVTVTDQYGAQSVIELEDGRSEVTITGSPQFFASSEGEPVSITPVEAFGGDVLAGAEVTATSTAEGSDAQIITSGTVNPSLPWRSGVVDGELDEKPSATVTLAEATTINRVAVASGSMECCETALRTYEVSVRTESGEWHTVASVEDQFWHRVRFVEFDAVSVTAVRITIPWTTVRGTRVLDVNYSGIVGGLPPPFMGVQTASDEVVSVAAISAWAPE